MNQLGDTTGHARAITDLARALLGAAANALGHQAHDYDTRVHTAYMAAGLPEHADLLRTSPRPGHSTPTQ